MSEVKLVLRDARENRSRAVPGSVADWFIAALSADPVLITELDAAVDRFALESPERGHVACFAHCLDAEPWDAGLVVIDLAARLVVINSSYSSPGHQGVVVWHNLPQAQRDSVSLRYQLADEWMFLYDVTDWEATAEHRRQQRAEQPTVDFREILYGEPMLRFIIQGCRQQFAQRDAIIRRVHIEWIEQRQEWNEQYAEKPQPDPRTLTMHELCRVSDPQQDIEHRIFYDTIRDIHAAWLMTPCPELNGVRPRTVMLQDRDRLSADMDNREFQWSILGQCPPGISPESHAFQLSGFNNCEIVMYYDYIRLVAWNCWDRLRQMSADELMSLDASQPKLDEFIKHEVARLRAVGEAWLDAPWDDDPSKTPRGMIYRERQRLPDNTEMDSLDPDCPFCQALGEMPGIGFWHVDGFNMDDLFAFSYDSDAFEDWGDAEDDDEGDDGDGGTDIHNADIHNADVNDEKLADDRERQRTLN